MAMGQQRTASTGHWWRHFAIIFIKCAGSSNLLLNTGLKAPSLICITITNGPVIYNSCWPKSANFSSSRTQLLIALSVAVGYFVTISQSTLSEHLMLSRCSIVGSCPKTCLLCIWLLLCQSTESGASARDKLKEIPVTLSKKKPHGWWEGSK